MPVLKSETNPFGGRIVDPDRLPEDADRFRRDLGESLESWRAEGVRVVWLQIPIERSELVPLAVEAGFVYHHATERVLQLTASIETGSYVPPFATHYIGAGGVVIDEERNLLVIQERHHRRRHYKLPGGALQPGEHIVDAVIREVEEETGVRTRFISLVCFRHWHGYRHGKSDIYFVTRLRPLTREIDLDPGEIAECFWMPVDEYLAHPDTHEFNRRIVQAALDQEASEAGCPQLRPDEIPEYGTPETHELFFPQIRGASERSSAEGSV
jgi:ADP-ribose pyrophosphatase YjhB (NUDIX family)